MELARLGASWEQLTAVAVSAVLAYAAVIAMTRLAGVRSLAKMSSFDFAATVAVGSTLSATLLGTSPLAAGVLGLALLFGLQYVVAVLRRGDRLRGAVDNSPVLLMAGPEVLDDNLRHVRLDEAELYSQLRLRGVQSRAQVRAVVMETTGDVSVLTTEQPLDPELLRGVRGAERLS